MDDVRPVVVERVMGRTPYDAIVEVLSLLGRAGPYAVFLVIVLYGRWCTLII